MDFIVFPDIQTCKFSTFFSATGHTFYQKNYGFTHFKPLWIPQTTLNLEDIT